MQQSPRQHTWLLSLLVSVATLWVVLIPEFFWTSDGPEHVYSAWLLSQGENIVVTHTAMGAILEVHTPLLAMGYLWPASLLTPWLGPYATHKLIVAFIVLANLLGGIRLLRRLGGNLAAIPLIGGISINYLLWFGFFNYLVAQACALWLLCWIWEVKQWSRTRGLLLAAGLLFIGWLHPLPSLFIGLLVGSVAATEGSPGQRLRRLLGLAIASVPFFSLLIVISLDMSAATLPSAQRPELVRALFGSTSVGGPFWRGLPLLWLALGGALWSVAAGASGRHRALGATAAAMLVFGVLGPYSIPTWEVFAPRFAVFGIYLGIALLPRLKNLRWRAAATAASCALLASNLLWSVNFNQRVSAGCNDILRAAAELPDHEGVSRFAVTRTCLDVDSIHDTPALPNLSFALHAGAIVALGREAMHSGFNAKRSIHAHTLGVTAPFGEAGISVDWHQIPDGIAQLGVEHPATMQQIGRAVMFVAPAERLVVFGPIEGIEPLLAYGFVHEQSVGNVHSFRFQPISGDDAALRILSPVPEVAVDIDYGWVPLAELYASMRLEPQRPDAALERLFRLPLLPRALVWVRVQPLGPHDGLRCLGANEDNLLVFDLRGGPRPMVCRLVPAGGTLP